METRPRAQPSSSISLTENALYILKKRYLRRGKQGHAIETPEEMFRRVAVAVASAERNYDPQVDIETRAEEFYQLMANLDFLPNSPTLLNADSGSGQLSACFTVPIEDTMESIFEAVKNTALIHKSGGGTGFSFSRLRPKGDRVGSEEDVAGGPVSLIGVFYTVTDSIKQGGIRQGCNIALLGVNHPDIMKFIVAKNNPNAFTNFYFSVAVTAEFMEAVKGGSDYSLVNPRTKRVVGRHNAKDVFSRIVAQSWKTGDPGILFIDQIERDNPTPHLGKIEDVSGCGEQPLLPYESCNLGSINLARMLKATNGNSEIDYNKLGRTAELAVRFLDNVIDVNRFPLPQIEEATKKTRKIGLGVMGFADMLIQLGIPYGSEEALEVADEVMRCVSQEAHRTSQALAEERGCFPAFRGSIYDVAGGHYLRNAACTTIAPCGTLSLIGGCSSGIEPIFALAFVRNIQGGDQLLEVNPYFVKLGRKEGFYSEELMKKLACGLKLSTFENVPDDIKRLFATATEIKPEWHVRMQAAFQRHTDSAVSKTVNLPHEATQEDIAKVYMMAYEEGLKGITVYRDKSRRRQPLSTNQAGLELVCHWLSREASYRL